MGVLTTLYLASSGDAGAADVRPIDAAAALRAHLISSWSVRRLARISSFFDHLRHGIEHGFEENPRLRVGIV